MITLNSILIIIFSYLLGSISFAIIVSKIFNINDPRTYGSKNPGATNILRSGKKIAAVLTLLGDFLKGYLLIFLLIRFKTELNLQHIDIALAAVFVVIGHMYPIFFKFKGGKGVATAIGVFLGLHFYLFLVCGLVWILTALITRISSLSAILALIITPISSFFIFNHYDDKLTIIIAIFIVSILVLLRHKTNIVNLLTGKELSFKKK